MNNVMLDQGEDVVVAIMIVATIAVVEVVEVVDIVVIDADMIAEDMIVEVTSVVVVVVVVIGTLISYTALIGFFLRRRCLFPFCFDRFLPTFGYYSTFLSLFLTF